LKIVDELPGGRAGACDVWDQSRIVCDILRGNRLSGSHGTVEMDSGMDIRCASRGTTCYFALPSRKNI